MYLFGTEMPGLKEIINYLIPVDVVSYMLYAKVYQFKIFYEGN